MWVKCQPSYKTVNTIVNTEYILITVHEYLQDNMGHNARKWIYFNFLIFSKHNITLISQVFLHHPGRGLCGCYCMVLTFPLPPLPSLSTPHRCNSDTLHRNYIRSCRCNIHYLGYLRCNIHYIGYLRYNIHYLGYFSTMLSSSCLNVQWEGILIWLLLTPANSLLFAKNNKLT